jgi:Xaa-Pro aminopeptidase|tara:strand:- start:920 stop:2113 length:1194 start_codon:yes stop_codon:yes gene_type:complete
MPQNDTLISDVLAQAQEYMQENKIDGWLLYDYRGMNPIFWDTIGYIPNVTRPCWLWIPASSDPKLVVSFVDQNRFEHLGLKTDLWVSREQMINILKSHMPHQGKVAMEYSPMGVLPRVTKVDGGTLELVRSLGVEVVTSADLIQFATQRWSDKELESHLKASKILATTVKEAFTHIGENIGSGLTEFEVAEFIRGKFLERDLKTPDGPVVAINDHAADPHFEPTENNSVPIKTGDWILIDLWGRIGDEPSVCADITWTAFIGDTVPTKHLEVFNAVVGGRDAAVCLLEKAHRDGRQLQGWEVDVEARNYIRNTGYGKYFSHRLGHSLGKEVHGNAVNLDGWETNDTRIISPGIGFTVEPGIYIPGEFGVRSEIDLFYYETGPAVTTEKQTTPYIIQV